MGLRRKREKYSNLLILFSFLLIAPTTSSQSFSTQLNSAIKATTATSVPVTVDSARATARPHQILSRETSFISKPVAGSEEKDENTPNVSLTVTTATTPQMTMVTTTTSASTVTITSKLSQLESVQAPKVSTPDAVTTATETVATTASIASSITATTAIATTNAPSTGNTGKFNAYYL